MRRMLIKVWKTIKSLNNGDKGERPNEIMIVNGREAEGEKSSEFIKQYAIVNRNEMVTVYKMLVES